MKIITLWEPWATLVAIGEKKIETRGWSTDYRGSVAIHSAKGGLTAGDLYETCMDDPFFGSLLEHKPFNDWHKASWVDRKNMKSAFSCGSIIAVGEVVDCLRTQSYRCDPGVFDDYPELGTDKEKAFGDYSEARYGIVIVNVAILEPIPFKSRQGKMLDLDEVTAGLVTAQRESLAL